MGQNKDARDKNQTARRAVAVTKLVAPSVLTVKSKSTHELITIDPVYNPIWRQAAYTLPFISRIGIIRYLFSWSLGIDPTSNLIWTYETMNTAHILLSGLLILAAFWHWAYWDLDVFFTSMLRLDLNQILSIHLTLASSLCLGFGALGN